MDKGRGDKRTFVTANWNVRSLIGCAVPFEIRDSIDSQSFASDGRETWKTVRMAEFVIVKSAVWAGSAEEKVQSSSAAAAGALLLLPLL